MVEYIVAGFFAGLGFCIGIVAFISGVAYLIKQAKKSSTNAYDEAKLAKAFETYDRKLRDEERYKEIPEVRLIIQHLKEGNIPEEVDSYVIKKRSDISLKEGDEDNQIIRMIERYIVIGKKTTA
jgi:hypothetical protein